jgi:tetratricopeptide (TPR) repeat protein
LAIRIRVLGPDHPEVAASRLNLAIVLEDRGEAVTAEAEYRRAVESMERSLDADHPDLAAARHALAQLLLLRRDRPDEALPLAELAWARRDHDDVPPLLQADTAFILARALWTRGPDVRQRATTLLERARDAYARAAAEGTPDDEHAVELARWLATPPP